jgi:hypothetical protein
LRIDTEEKISSTGRKLLPKYSVTRYKNKRIKIHCIDYNMFLDGEVNENTYI